MIELIVSDLDGTLLGKDSVLTDRIVSFVKGLRSRNILFTIATGRVDSITKQFTEQLDIDIPYITCNGASIIQGDSVVERQVIPIAPLKSVLTHARDMGLTVIYSIDEKEFVFDSTPWIEKQRTRHEDMYKDVHFPTESDWKNFLVNKVTIFNEERDGRIESIKEMCSAYSSRFNVTQYTNRAIELVHRDSSKSGSVKKIAESLNVDMSAVLYIGDHQNDVDALEEAGVGAAVANAIEAAKAAADYICGHAYEQGVIEAVSKFCNCGEEGK